MNDTGKEADMKIVRQRGIATVLVILMAFAWAPVLGVGEFASAEEDADKAVATEDEAAALAEEETLTDQEKKAVQIDPLLLESETNAKDSANAVEAARQDLNQAANVSGKISLDAKELDSLDAQVIFNENARAVSFVTYNLSQYAYSISTYNVETGQYTEDITLKYKDHAYYCEDNHTFYTVRTTCVSDGNGQYIFTPIIETYNLYTHETNTKELAAITSTRSSNLISALGVDSRGRIYLAAYDHYLYLYSPEGTQLSRGTFNDVIYSFFGFDKNNGNFYYRGYENWVYWGYDHDMASLKAGNVSANGEVTVAEKNLMLLYQIPFFTHAQSCKMFNGRYLAALSIFGGNKLVVLDSTQYDTSDYTQQETTIHMIDGSVETSLLNIANTAAIKAQLTTAASDFPDDEYFDVSSTGPRCAVSDDGKTMIAKTDSNVLTKYDLENNKKLLQVNTAHKVYDFSMDGDKCIVLEREGNDLYVEQIDWTLPETFEVSVSKPNMTVGDTGKVSASADSNLQLTYEYSSSYSPICSVDARGQLSAWAKGSVFIYVTCKELGKQKNVKVSVDDSELSASQLDYSFCNTKGGAASTNAHLPYTSGAYGSVTKSYLAKEGENLVRVEYLSGKVVAETYNRNYQLVSSKKIDSELPLFGGFFSGDNAYYLAFGKENVNESDSAEVFRFVKYDKNWNRLGACSVKGANTYIPFDAGGLAMCERNGMLYVHTCHEMYKSDDGYHHQANCDFKINEANMILADSYTGVMNLSEGYVSHSFQQKVCADESMLYRADLGDAYPRGIALSGTPLNRSFDSPSIYGTVVSIPTGGYQNYTGFALGGLDYSDSSYIIAGCGIAKDYNETRNIFVSSSYKDNWTQNATWLTNYAEGGEINVNTPKIVKLNSNQFLLLWEETKGRSYRVKMVLLGPDGKKTSSVYTVPLMLSDCEPIVDDEGYVVWYVTQQSSPAFVKINPYRLSDAAAHITQDGPPVIVQNIACKTVRLSATKYVYNGKAKKPTVSISGMTAGKDFTFVYKNNVKVGKAKVTVTGKGNYTGKKTQTFIIVPKGTAISTLKAAKKAFTVKWKKQAVQTTGYQIMYATNKKFTKGKKTVTVAKNRIVSKKITKLKSKKYYYVKIRTYKTIAGVKYCSAWSKVKKVKTK